MGTTRRAQDAARQPATSPARRAFLLAMSGVVIVGCGRDAEQPSLATESKPKGPVRPPLPTKEPEIRVRIARARREGMRVRVGDPGRAIEVTSVDTAPVVLRAPLSIGRDAEGWVLADGDGRRGRADGVSALVLSEFQASQPAIRLDERVYPGRLRLESRTDGSETAFEVINDLPLEAYLPGVVAGELFANWKYETRAAQAIAARSYAVAEQTYFKGRRTFDVSNTASSQVYMGRVSHRGSIKAVRQTKGQVLEWRGALVPGYYSSCCGGLAARAADAIGGHPANTIAPLDGRSGPDVCTDAEVARWSTKRSLVAVIHRLRTYAKRNGLDAILDLGTLAEIIPSARNPHGRPQRYRLRDGDGNYAVLGERQLRLALDQSVEDLPAPTRRLRSGHLNVAINSGTVTIDGHGFGHGVGLCQYGAETLARDGKMHPEILSWYYPGAKIVRAY